MEGAWKKYILREYLKNPLDAMELQDLQEKLWGKAIDFVRTNEKEFIESGLNKDSDNIAIIKLVTRFPNLLQRPIVMSENKAIIGRPPEDILKIFKK